MEFLTDNFKHLTTTPENVEQLKKLVLQMAVQGRLTANWREENPDMEPASVLLEKIKAEKEKLIKDGQIKRQKPLPAISDEEKPFDLPGSWEWERLGNVGMGFEYGTSSKSIRVGDIPVLRMGNLQNGEIIWDNLVYSANENDNQMYLLQENDLLFNRTNSRELVGKTSLFSNYRKAIYAGYLIRFHMMNGISSVYTNYVMNSPLHRNWCDEVKTDAIGQSNINATKLKNFRFPVPPLAEQQAIVSKVEQLFSQIDQLHALAQKRINYREKSAKALFSKINNAGNDAELQDTWQTLTSHFHNLTQSKESVKQLRQSILQMAVQGKLTAKWREENPDVEPAGVLLEKIKAEKEQLIKDGKIKREKTLPPISEEEMPYELPNNWVWIRFPFVFTTISSREKQVMTKEYLSQGKYPIVDQGQKLIGGYFNDSSKLIRVKTPLIIFGDHTKEVKYVNFDFIPGADGTKILKFFFRINVEFTYYSLKSLDLGNRGYSRHFKILKNKLIPICPVEEQEVIVTKVKQLMSWCDELEKKIEKRDAYQGKMMQAVVKQAFKMEKETVEVL
ncbi:restriction endonuclease subunit S [Marinilabilia salmonicolor]|uniref:Type I restriction enzyme S subunit n=1 Tax=Marinilabilia salmonicolor TaxID=989 RepID=A0A368UNE3_9BACT|nr:restriction endonuclease subunit S [Marinilabilia salmonicolor]RCW28924.1 type I restriction enzyme S subunit [Marinilabilia salmonicolor]